MKMHLVARVPNEGAHRLAWWIGEQVDGSAAIDDLARRIGFGVMIVDRLLTGEVTPAERVGMAIMAATRGAVEPRDWYRATDARWGEAPASREIAKAA